jgi:lipoyl(octanoyl) transferase
MFNIIVEKDIIDYEVALNRMLSLYKEVYSQKVNILWMLEHNHVYTIGISAKERNLVKINGIRIYQTDRGGQITYHGPGQRICYVMMNLIEHYGCINLKRYIDDLQKWIINTLIYFGIKGEIRNDRIGVWIVDNKGIEKKIASIGIRVRRYISYHGISLNINPDLKYFDYIIPCGLSEYKMCSINSLGIDVNQTYIDHILIKEFKKIFESA